MVQQISLKEISDEYEDIVVRPKHERPSKIKKEKKEKKYPTTISDIIIKKEDTEIKLEQVGDLLPTTDKIRYSPSQIDRMMAMRKHARVMMHSDDNEEEESNSEDEGLNTHVQQKSEEPEEEPEHSKPKDSEEPEPERSLVAGRKKRKIKLTAAAIAAKEEKARKLKRAKKPINKADKEDKIQ